MPKYKKINEDEGKEFDENLNEILAVHLMNYRVNFLPRSVEKYSHWCQDVLPRGNDTRC